MLKPQDITITVFTTARGDALEVVHKPTGISRFKGPPIDKPGKTQHEIEAELIQQRLTQHILKRSDTQA